LPIALGAQQGGQGVQVVHADWTSPGKLDTPVNPAAYFQEIFSAAHIELHERAYLEGLDLQHLKLNPGSTPANLLLHLHLWFVGQHILLE
jgi:hypothetical protein